MRVVDAFNVFEAEVPPEADESRPEGFRRRHVQIGPVIGASHIGATLYEVPSGQRISPYHYHYNDEEWLLVVEGRPTLRTPTGERELRPGDLVAFPEGPSGAHGVSNHTDERARVLLLSTKRRPAVAVYPDSNKMAIWRLDEGEADEIVFPRTAAAEYWDGEVPSREPPKG